MDRDVVDEVTGETFRRVIGHRQRPRPFEPPSVEARAALAAMADYDTGAPKGVFRYRSHEEANRHREDWTIRRLAGR